VKKRIEMLLPNIEGECSFLIMFLLKTCRVRGRVRACRPMLPHFFRSCGYTICYCRTTMPDVDYCKAASGDRGADDIHG
jgi:hypothetical protein